MSDYAICPGCEQPFETHGEQSCPSCQWVTMKNELCNQCDCDDMIECDTSDGGHCAAGGYHCRWYHVDCAMMQPYQYEMFSYEEDTVS